MTARTRVGIGVGVVLLGAAGAFYAWSSWLSPDAYLRGEYARVVELRAKELAAVAQAPPASEATKKQIAALIDRYRRLPGIHGLELMAQAYAARAGAANPSVVAANKEVMTGLSDGLFSALWASEIQAAVEFVDKRVGADPVLRPVMTTGRDNLRLRGPRDYRDKYSEAYAFERKGDFNSAVRSYQQAISLAQRHDLAVPEMRGFLGLASSYRSLGRTVDVETACLRTEQRLRETTLEDDRPLGQIYYHLSEAYQAIGHQKPTYDALQKALAIHRAHAAQDPMSVVLDLLALTTTCGSVGKFDDALQYGNEAVRLSCTEPSPTRSFCGPAIMNVAGVKAGQSKFAEAETLYKDALARLAREQPKPVRALYMVLRNYSAMMAKQGKAREAQALQARADALFPAPTRKATAGVPGVPVK